MDQHSKNHESALAKMGLSGVKCAHWNLPAEALITESVKRSQGLLTSTGALACDTGEFTGRSPKDKYIVRDSVTEKTVWWGEVNNAFASEDFEALHHKMLDYLKAKEVFVRYASACSKPEYRLNICVVTEEPWQNLFAHNLFLRPSKEELLNFQAEWVILAIPGFRADPKTDKTRQHNFTIIDFTKKIILIGGSAYTGEIKKAIFTVLNYVLPQDKDVLSMHCSANIGEAGDTAIFFGLSGTGKTTLSADPGRRLIGDDEHGWASDSVFNIEGGCYAKCINLTADKEPQIFNAIRFGTLLENIGFYENSLTVDYTETSRTENTRAAYPLDFIENAVIPSIGDIPKNIFFLTCDAFGVLPPISKLTIGQAMYHFISGYTSKVAGTETGITEPQTTFSACFGKPFLPLHPIRYAEMLGKKLNTMEKPNVWLINTGWTGGPYGTGERIKLSFTRAMITAALEGKLDNAVYTRHRIFGLEVPMDCPGVPAKMLDPKRTWADPSKYDKTANDLAEKFIENFELYRLNYSSEILAGSPTVLKAEKEKL